MRFLTLGVLVAGLECDAVAQVDNEKSLGQLLEAGRWFELRDALEGTSAPALYEGAVAAAFDRIEDAETSLRQAIREASTVGIANEARELLSGLYLRLGRSADAGRLFDEILQVAPDRSDIEIARALFGAFSDSENQTVEAHQPATFRCVEDGSLQMPVLVNGTPVTWGVDTGANVTMLSESEAQMLGIAIDETTARASDLAGGATAARPAVADHVVIGGTALRHVRMLVLPDSQPPFNEIEPGERGVIGLSVFVALETLHWTTAGPCRTGPSADPGADHRPNLTFDQLFLVTRAESDGRELDFVFDTGNHSGTSVFRCGLTAKNVKAVSTRSLSASGSRMRPSRVR